MGSGVVQEEDEKCLPKRRKGMGDSMHEMNGNITREEKWHTGEIGAFQ